MVHPRGNFLQISNTQIEMDFFPVCGASKCSAAARLHLVRGVARLQAKEYAAPGEADILNMAALEKHRKSAKLP